MSTLEKLYPLHQACMDGNLAKVQELVEELATPDDIVALDSDNRTPLHWAVSFQREEIVTYLLSFMKEIDLDKLA